jgi:poly(A) polymerase
LSATLSDSLARAPALLAVRDALADRGCWVVGGAVRDAALGRKVTDVDLVLAGSPREAAIAIARASGGSAFELSSEFSTWRAVGAGGGWHVDVAALRGEGIEADLLLRDLTVNAVALPLGGGEPIDPSGGLRDLERRLARAVGARAFADDPLRLLRLARLAAGLGLEIEPETERPARSEAPRAAEPAGERLYAELAALIGGADPVRGVELLESLELTPVVLPELAAMRGVGQSANHHLDAYGHTIEVLRRWLAVEADLDRYAGAVAPEVAAALAEPLADGLTRNDALRWGALLHDIGKPGTRTERDGFVSFLGHDALGAGMVRDACRRLRTSRRFAEQLTALTRHHLVLGFMVRERPLPPRRVWDYLELTGEQAIDVTLLTVADRLSAQGGGVPEEAITGHLELAQEMLAAAVELERSGPPAPLLRGDEIAAALAIEPGPELGVAVAELRAAQYAGEVADAEAARAHLRGWWAAR